MTSQGGKDQKVWEEASRQRTKRVVNGAWREEQTYRKKHGKPSIVGYRITAGKNCPHAKPYDGSTFLIEDVYDEPDLLPPYDGCKHDACECKYTPATADQKRKARIVLKFDSLELQAKLITRTKSPVGFEHSSAGEKAGAKYARRIPRPQRNRLPKYAKNSKAAKKPTAKMEPAGCAPAVLISLALMLLLVTLC